MKEQPEEICKLTVQRNGWALQFIKYPLNINYLIHKNLNYIHICK